MPWAAVRGHGDLADLQRGVHVLTDKIGIPFGWTADSTNHNDSVLLESTLEDGARRAALSPSATRFSSASTASTKLTKFPTWEASCFYC